ncbi:MAG: hypothetical protein ACTSSI_02835 [Candidatus Helarchaeota archaeon]
MIEMRCNELYSKEMIRNVPGWSTAPVPLCFGGDYRALTFCCHPAYPLTFSSHCKRKNVLSSLGITEEEFVKIKDEFADEYDLWDDSVCFKSLSYCCMRRGGCPGNRDRVLIRKYGNGTERGLTDEILEKYFKMKKELAIRILKKARRQDLVEEYIKEMEGP